MRRALGQGRGEIAFRGGARGLQVPWPLAQEGGRGLWGRLLLVLRSSLGICCGWPSDSWGDRPSL